MKTWTYGERALGILGASTPLIGAFFGILIYLNIVGESLFSTSQVINWNYFPAALLYATTLISAGLMVLMSIVDRFERGERICKKRVAFLLALFAFGAYNGVYFLLR